MQKLDLLLNYDCLGSERNLRALNLASRIGIDIISDPSCNLKQKTCRVIKSIQYVGRLTKEDDNRGHSRNSSEENKPVMSPDSKIVLNSSTSGILDLKQRDI